MKCNDCPHYIANNETCCHAAIEPVKRVTYGELQWYLSHIAEFMENERLKEQKPYNIEDSLTPINFNTQTIESLRSQWDAYYQQERYDYESE